jgi:hypothetical protein
MSVMIETDKVGLVHNTEPEPGKILLERRRQAV